MIQPDEEYERLLADKQRVVDSLSQKLTGLFEKNSRNSSFMTNDSTSQQHQSTLRREEQSRY